MRKYFLFDGNTVSGPLNITEISFNELSNNTYIWYYGLKEWIYLYNCNDENINLILNRQIPTHTKTRFFRWINLKYSLLSVTFLILVVSVFHLKSHFSVENQIRKSSFDSNDDLNIYLTKFFRDLEYYGINSTKPSKIQLRMSYLDKSYNTSDAHAISLGLGDDSKIEIYINYSSWTNLTRPQKYLLMYHELGHDVLNLDHTVLKASGELEIMNPILYRFDNISMDDFIEASQRMFSNYQIPRK